MRPMRHENWDTLSNRRMADTEKKSTRLNSAPPPA